MDTNGNCIVIQIKRGQPDAKGSLPAERGLFAGKNLVESLKSLDSLRYVAKRGIAQMSPA